MATERMATAVRSHRPQSLSMGVPKWIDVHGIKTRYFEAGSGEPIVFIHGVHIGATDGSSSAQTWELNFPVLAVTHNVISYDKIGQGYTDNPKRDEDYTMHAIVQHAIGFLDALGKKPYHIVGHSRGGYIVTRITMERRDLVKTCTCVSSGTLSPGWSRTQVAVRHRPQPESTRESIRWYLQKYSFNPGVVTEEWLDYSLEIALLEKTKIAAQKMDGGLMSRLFAPQLLVQRTETHKWLIQEGMPQPTLIVWGFEDPGADLEPGLQLVELFMKKQRKTEFRLFNRSGHFVFREHPAAFNHMLDSFVAANA